MLQFRLCCQDVMIDFTAHQSCFQTRLHTVFVRLSGQVRQPKATLEIKHSVHGWLKICDAEHRYPIIDNPLLACSKKLWAAAQYTLAEGDTWPSEEQKRHLKLERQAKQRAEEADRRRRRFKMIKR